MDVVFMQDDLESTSNWRSVKRKSLEEYNDAECRARFRLPKSTIQDIVDKLRDDLTHTTNRNNAIPPDCQVIVALRLLASGSFQNVIGDTGNLSQSSTSRILHRFCTAFNRHFEHLIHWYESEDSKREAKMNFYRSSGMKGLLGLIDGTMIAIKGVAGPDEPIYICRKNFPAINVQVTTGPKGEIRDASILYPGSSHDSFIFNNSGLKTILEEDSSKSYILGDGGYALSPTVITPFINPVTPQEKHFNKVHKATRSQVERNIGHLKSRWRCLDKSGGHLQYDPSTCCKIIFTCALLHNYCVQLGLEDEEDEPELEPEPEEQLNVPEDQSNIARLGAIRRREIMDQLWQKKIFEDNRHQRTA